MSYQVVFVIVNVSGARDVWCYDNASDMLQKDGGLCAVSVRTNETSKFGPALVNALSATHLLTPMAHPGRNLSL